MAQTKTKKAFVQMRQDRVPGDIHRRIIAHQKFMNLSAKHEVSLEEAAIDLWKRGIENLAHLNP